MHARRSSPVLAVATLCLALVWSPSQAQNLCFGPSTTYQSGLNALATCAADLDGDGHLDLAVTGLSRTAYNNVSILRNMGTGSFVSTGYTETGGWSYSISAADLDGNGQLELAVPNLRNANVSILRYNLDSLSVLGEFQTIGVPRCVVAGDLDADGHPDLVVTGNGFSVLKNNGDGTFASPVLYGGGALWAALADVDGDGHLDIALATNFGISVTKNLGDGTFGPEAFYGHGYGTRFVTAADFNGDGFLDLAAANADDSTVTVFRNDGAGVFPVEATYYVGPNPNSIAAADLNGDGRPDLAVTTSRVDQASIPGSVVVLTNNGDATFSPALSYAVGLRPVYVASADLDGNGAADLAVVDRSGEISVFTSCRLSCNCPGQGDLNSDGNQNVLDVAGLVDLVFGGVPAPARDPSCPHIDRGDMDCNGEDNVLDVVRLIDYAFGGGAAPCNPCACMTYPLNCP